MSIFSVSLSSFYKIFAVSNMHYSILYYKLYFVRLMGASEETHSVQQMFLHYKKFQKMTN